VKSKILAWDEQDGQSDSVRAFDRWPTYYAICGGLFVLLALLSDFSFQKKPRRRETDWDELNGLASGLNRQTCLSQQGNERR
jgi:hypothetical protein